MIELRQLAGFHARNVGAASGPRAICDVFITALDVHDRAHPCYMVHKPIVFAAADLATVKLLHDRVVFRVHLLKLALSSLQSSFSRIGITWKCRALYEPTISLVSLISVCVSHAWKS